MRTILFLLLMAAKIHAQTIQFPVKASNNKKYLADQAGKPVFLNGCASWRLTYALTFQEARQYLKDRKAKGFNAVMIHITPDIELLKDINTNMSYRPNAFFDRDISKPNEQFFSHFDSVLNLCNEMNMAVFVAPLYLGCCKDGWLEIIQQYPDGEKKCREYGQWFANRYKHFPNLIWVSGGDHNAVPESIAFAEGIASVDTSHLHTSHAHPGKSSAERFPGKKWHTLSSAYTYFPAMETDTNWQYHHVYEMFYKEMLNNYRMPSILIESAYEDERNTTTQMIRRQAYWSLLSGASGHIYGHRDVWRMNNNWMNALNTPGVESMRIFQSFIKTIPWYNMKADWAHSVFTSGRGYFNSTINPGGEDYATGGMSYDSTMAVLYIPSYRKVCVNMQRFRSAVTAKWFDPSSGIYKNVAGTFKNSGVSYFTPPSLTNSKGFDDWVLVVLSK